MKKEIEKIIKKTVIDLGILNPVFSIEHPEETKHGDYSSNVAMVYAKELNKKPTELANQIKEKLDREKINNIEKIDVAGVGFINFYLSKDFFHKKINEILEEGNNWGRNNLLKDKKVMVEYTDPNPFKPFHIGHLMANAIGESISRIIEYSGANVIRANYQGDVGLHVAKAIYGLRKFNLPNEDLSISDKAIYIGECYSKASNLYDEQAEVKKEIDNLNKKIYKKDPDVKEIYDWGREITLEAFEVIYKILGTEFDYYFFESDMVASGEKIVKENMGKIFKKSEGAIIFEGNKHDPKLHTRVFVTSDGLPTYEAKEIGLTLKKFEKNDLDLSIVTTAEEQAEYMKVVQKAISLIYPEIEKKMKHITHGMMKLKTGKMSSRMGNIITGESLISDSIKIILDKIKERDFSLEEKKEISEKIGVSALKYSILKSSLGSDIVYDFEKSISFEGDSGPYLQYTAVRANSVIEKAKEFKLMKFNELPNEISDLEKKLYLFDEIVEKAYLNLEPHHIVNYLTELASSFNSFYGKTRILDDKNKEADYHLKLVKSFYLTMKNGLYLLGIKLPSKM